MELEDGADGPLEALAGVPQVGHDVAVLPPALDRPGPAQVGGGRGPVMDRPQQMPELVSRHDDPGEAAGVLHDGHAVDLLQPLVHDTGPTHVGKPGRAPVTVSITSLPSETKRMHILSYVLSVMYSTLELEMVPTKW